MLVFLWVLGAMGVAFAAKLKQRNAFGWFLTALALSPLVGGLVFWVVSNKVRLRGWR